MISWKLCWLGMCICPLWGNRHVWTPSQAQVQLACERRNWQTRKQNMLRCWSSEIKGFALCFDPLRPVRRWNLKLRAHLVISVLSASTHLQFTYNKAQSTRARGGIPAASSARCTPAWFDTCFCTRRALSKNFYMWTSTPSRHPRVFLLVASLEACRCHNGMRTRALFCHQKIIYIYIYI